MAKLRMVRFAETWTPDPDDPLGEDKRRLVAYLLENQVTVENSRLTIESILDAGLFSSREDVANYRSG